MDALTRQAWHEEVYLVLQATKAVAQLETNMTTGYHVHVGVGRGPDQRYTLTELKKIAALVVLYEDIIDRLHLWHHSVGSYQNYYILSNRSNTHLGHLSNKDILQRIFGAPDVSSLMHLTNPPIGLIPDISTNYEMPANRYYKVNFVSLNKYGTIEFRQHAGTLDPGTVCAWADFVLAFVRVAIQMSEETLDSIYLTKPSQ